MYADNTQHMTSFAKNEAGRVPRTTHKGIDDIRAWIKVKSLKLNESATKAIFIDTKTNFKKSQKYKKKTVIIEN